MEKSSLILNAQENILPSCLPLRLDFKFVPVYNRQQLVSAFNKKNILLIILAFLWCFLRLKKSSLSEKARSWESSAVKHQILYLYLICILCQNLLKGKMAWQIALFLISFFLFSFIFGRMLHFGHLFFSFLILQPNT